MSTTKDSRMTAVAGRGIVLRGDDIDTDRIIPARFLRAVTFEGLGDHVFEDDRQQMAAQGAVHRFSDPRFAGASVLVVNRNFGCGSSREHAPQALMRWGVRAIVGESFSEIFFGNATMLGIPCVTVDEARVEALMARIEGAPGEEIVVSLVEPLVRVGTLAVPAGMPAAARDAFLNGLWDPTSLLLDRFDEVRAVVGRLPYVRGFADSSFSPRT